MSPNRRDFLAMLAGGAASLALFPKVSTANPMVSEQPAIRLRGTMDGVTCRDGIHVQSAWIEFRIDSDRITVNCRTNQQGFLDSIESTDPAVVGFMAQVREFFELHADQD